MKIVFGAKSILGFILALGAGCLTAFYTTPSTWENMSNGLIAFLGFLSAAVIQVMPLTVNFFQGESLNPTQIKALAPRLENQQNYWAMLFIVTMLSLFLLIFTSAFASDLKGLTIDLAGGYFLKIDTAIVGLLGFFLTLVFYKSFGLFSGLSALANARRNLSLAKASHIADSEVKEVSQSFDSRLSNLPENYGSIIRH